MKLTFRFACITVSIAALVTASAPAQAGKVLDGVKQKGAVTCGVHTGRAGFALADSNGKWSGLDVDYCRAVAAAVLGDAGKVKYTPTSVQQRWPVLQSGQVDLLSRNTTITFSRNASLGVNFQGINFYEGQTFVVRAKSGAKEPKDLDGATICVAAGSTEEKTAADWYAERKLKVTIVNFQKNDDAIAAYTQATKFAANPATAWFNLCAVAYNQGQMDRAVIACNAAIATDPTKADAYVIQWTPPSPTSGSPQANLIGLRFSRNLTLTKDVKVIVTVWSGVEPTIFGTLFLRTLDPAHRAAACRGRLPQRISHQASIGRIWRECGETG